MSLNQMAWIGTGFLMAVVSANTFESDLFIRRTLASPRLTAILLEANGLSPSAKCPPSR